MFHKKLKAVDMHVIQAWEVAAIADRDALSLTLEDNGKVCMVWEADGPGNPAAYLLADFGTPIWIRLGYVPPANMEILATPAIFSGYQRVDAAVSDYHKIVLDDDYLLEIINAVDCRSLMILIEQDATTPYDLDWTGAFTWNDGVEPTLDLAVGEIGILALSTFDAGTVWHATYTKRQA